MSEYCVNKIMQSLTIEKITFASIMPFIKYTLQVRAMESYILVIFIAALKLC